MNRNKLLVICFWLLVIIPAVLVFRNLFLPGILWGGDAPFFYPSAIEQLIARPNLFTERGIPFGGFNQVLWLWPLMYLFGVIGKFLGSDVALRALFLFPSLILAGLGPYFLTKYLKFSGVVRFFAVLTYLLNTYYILLVDGGQVGVALAYGIFPFALLFLIKDPFSIIGATLTSEALILADPRIFVIAFSTAILWRILEKKFIFRIFYIIPPLILLNFYWLLPLMKAGDLSVPSGVNNLDLLSLINPLVLFSPHWPANVFGKIAYPPFYFAFVPILIFGSFLFPKRDKFISIFAFLFLLFAFLTKGGNCPFGFIYDFLVNKVPFGAAFRDSSKFFIPVMLFAGILIGKTMEKLKSYGLWVMGYLFFLFLIFPALLGKLNFLLSNHKVDSSFSAIYQNLKADPTEFRTVWFPEKHPLAYETNEIPALNARDLVRFRPFAAMNAGEDVFNFLNNPKYVDWLRVLGIKYLFLPGDPRNPNPNESEQKLWQEVVKLVGATSGLKKEEWGTSFAIFEVPQVFPRNFTVEKLIAVVGPDLPLTYPAVYFEDGKLDPEALAGKDPASIKILFNGGEEIDLTMSFLQKHFRGVADASLNQWASYKADEYLKYKYELLQRGFKLADFDYSKGVAFSTVKGETLKFRFKVPEKGEYFLAVRRADIEKQKLTWEIEKIELPKGEFVHDIINLSPLSVFNAIALIPAHEFEKADSEAKELIARYGTFNLSQIKDAEISPAGFWQITSTAYNTTRGSVPVYSMVNGYYLK